MFGWVTSLFLLFKYLTILNRSTAKLRKDNHRLVCSLFKVFLALQKCCHLDEGKQANDRPPEITRNHLWATTRP